MIPDPGKDRLVNDALNRLEKPLLRYTKRLIGDLDRARDVVQDAFLQLWKQDPNKVNEGLTSWLYTVCRNRALDYLRKEGRLMSMESECAPASWAHPAPLPSTVLEKTETTQRVQRIIEALPVNQREVIQLKFQEGMSYKKISEITGHSVSNVGFLIHTAVKNIRHQLLEPTVN